MPGSLPITGVTAGDQQVPGVGRGGIGVATIANVSPSIAPSSIDSLALGARTLVYFEGANGASVLFEFTQAYPNPSPYAQFRFGTGLLITAAGVGAPTKFGFASIENAARAVYVDGFDATKFGRLISWHYSTYPAVGRNFAFTDAYPAVSPLNTPFYFGGQLVASGLTVGDTMAFGYIEKITKPPQLWPDGFDANGVGQRMRVGRYPDTNFFFTQAYTNPSPYAQFHFGTDQPISAGDYLATQFGVTNVRNYAQAVYPEGMSALGIAPISSRIYRDLSSGANVDFFFDFTDLPPNPLNVPFYFEGQLNPRPPGFSRLIFGVPRVIGIGIKPLGDDYLALGEFEVKYRQRVTVNPWTLQDAYGHPADVDYEIRYRYFNGIDSLSIGTHTAWRDPEYVYLNPSDTSTFYGNAWVGYPQEKQIQGFDSLEFSENLSIDYRRIKPTGFATAEYGNLTANLQKRYIYVTDEWLEGFYATPPKIYNLDSYIAPDPFLAPNTFTPGPLTDYGAGWQISGPEGPIQPYPISGRLRFGYHAIRLGAQAAFVNGLASLEFSPNDVSHYTRYVGPPGYPQTNFGWLWSIQNAAWGIAPSGFYTFGIGPDLPDIRDARQDWDYRHQSLTHTEYGTPMVAHRVRAVLVDRFRDRDIPEWSNPRVWTNKVVVNGFLAGDLGGTWSIHEQRNILKPSGWHSALYGEVHIVNRNREYTMDGIPSLAFGTHSIRDNKLFPLGDTHTKYGTAWQIADRTQRVTAWPPWLSLTIPWPNVRHDPVPPETQFILQTAWNGPLTEYGAIDAWSGNIFPPYIEDLHFGLPTVRSNSIYPNGWFSSVDNFPDHAMVYARHIKPPSFYLGQNPEIPGLYGTPFMWPHYIYAPHPIYNFEWYLPLHERIGTATIANKNRRIYQTHTPYDTIEHVIGEHSIDLLNRRYYMTGFNRFRYGMPVMLGGIRTWAVAATGNLTEYGTPNVGPPYEDTWSPYLLPSGVDSFIDGDTEIQLKNRNVYVNGFDSFLSNTDTNKMPGPVHSPRLFDWDGYDATEWGEDTFIDFKIRYKDIQGFESFTCRPSPGRQMRVSRTPAGTAPVHALR